MIFIINNKIISGIMLNDIALNHLRYDFSFNWILSYRACRMDEEMMFSLSYELLTQKTEEEIRKCDLRQDGTYYVQELNRASDILRFWFILAMSGYPGVPDMERIDADRLRLEGLIRGLRETMA